MSGRGPARVGDLVQGLLRERGLDTQLRRQGVLEDWAERVGERIASVTRPTRVADAVLFVEVRSSAWMMELNLMKREILARVNEGRGEAPIERIVFTLMEGGTHADTE